MTKNYYQPESFEAGIWRSSHDPQGKRRAGAGLVSVVIPCYNQARFLGEAIESVLAQSYPHFEIIVVDDGSTDDTAEVAARYPNVRCIRQDNQGRSAARNAGLNYSEGEYVVFLDADDRLLPEALEVGVEQLCAHPECAFVSGNCRLIAADGSPLRERQSPRPPLDKGDSYLAFLRREYLVIPGAVMYRRLVFDTVGGFDTSSDILEDYDLYLRIAGSFTVHHHGEVVLEYRRHGTNMTPDPALMLQATLAVLRRQRKHVKGNPRYQRAHRIEMREVQERYGMSVAAEVRTYLHEGQWKQAIHSMLMLLRFYPRGLALLSEPRMERHRLARRLRNRTQELRAHERKLKAREQQLKELESTLVEERQEAQQLRLQVQNLGWRLQEVGSLGASTRKLLQRLKKRRDWEPRRKGISLRVGSRPRCELPHVRQTTETKSAGSQRSDTPGSMEQKARFFLVGEMKSGTSWLMTLLDSHPEIFCSAEGSFFGQDQATDEMLVYEAPAPSLYNAILNCESLRTWHSLDWNRWGKGAMEEDLRNLTRLAIDYYLAKGSAASGKRIVGDKSPLHADHVDEIFDFYPEAKVIHIFRDGRDVAVSLMHHFWNLARDTKGRRGIYDLDPEEVAKRDAYLGDPEAFLSSGASIFTEARLRQMATRWSRRVRKASHDGLKLSDSNFFQVRYEDLLEESEENLKAMFEFLGAQADDDIVHQCVKENSFRKVAGRPAGHEDSKSFMRKGVAGDWRRVFTERDRRVYEEIARDTLLEMGYSL